MNAGQLQRASEQCLRTLESCSQNGRCQSAACPADRPHDQDCSAANPCPVLIALRWCRLAVRVLFPVFGFAGSVILAYWENEQLRTTLVAMTFAILFSTYVNWILFQKIEVWQRKAHERLQRIESKVAKEKPTEQPNNVVLHQLALPADQTARAISAQ